MFPVVQLASMSGSANTIDYQLSLYIKYLGFRVHGCGRLTLFLEGQGQEGFAYLILEQIVRGTVAGARCQLSSKE